MSDVSTIADLKPDKRNPRRHDLRNIGMITASLEEVGAARSIVIDEAGNILAGNGTVEAAVNAGIGRVQVVDADGQTLIAVRRTGLTEEQKRRLSLLDNRTAELAEWEPAVLAELAQGGVPLDDLWTQEELDALLAGGNELPAPGGGGDEFDTTPEEGPTLCQPGDLWQLGAHRLLCGDSTKREDVERLMGGEKATVVTDPPYGIGVNTSWLSKLNVQRGTPPCKNDNTLVNDDGMLDLAWLFRYPEWLVFGFPFIGRSELYTGLLVWDKRGDGGEGGLGNPVEVAASNAFNGYRLIRHLWAGYFRESGEDRQDHPTQKPIGTMSDAINLVKSKIIFDPFLGSGTTLIAAERLGRRCYGIEIEPRYCDVILRRYEAETGQKPVLIEHGTPDQVHAGPH